MAKKYPGDEESDSEQTSPFAAHTNLDHHGRMVPAQEDINIGDPTTRHDPPVRVGSATGIASDTDILLTLNVGGTITTKAERGPFSPIVCTIIDNLLVREHSLRSVVGSFLSQLRPGTKFLVRLRLGSEPPDEEGLEWYDLWPTLEGLANVDCRYIATNYSKHGRWCFCPREHPSEFIDFQLVPSYALHVEQLKNRCQLVTEKVADIEAQRSALLENTVGPLLNEIESQLRTAALPEIDRAELLALKCALHHDAYYPGVISTEQAAQILGIGAPQVRKLANQGLVGHNVSVKAYVFHGADVERFADLDRPTGVNVSPKKFPKNSG